MSMDEFNNLIDNEIWEGEIPSHIIKKLKTELNVPNDYCFDHLESDEDIVYLGFENVKV